MKRNRLEIWVHVLFWLLFYADRSYSVYRYYLSDYGLLVAFLVNITDIAVILVLFYCNYFLLIPRLLRRGRYGWYGLCAALLIGLTFALQYLYAIFISELLVDCKTYLVSFEQNKLYYLMQDVFYLLVSSGARFTSDWIRDKKLREELEEYKVDSELQMLKYQISPHFLHNTLHNIHYLVGAQPRQAEESIIKLSELMRYMLHTVKLDYVRLTDEIDYIRHFVELQSLRLSRPDIVHMAVEGECEGRRIRPLLLISFVENAFKHGDVSSGTARINIRAEVKNDRLYFEVENGPARRSKEPTTGIGIHNVRRRLELLYPDKHELTIEQTESLYRVVLELDLK